MVRVRVTSEEAKTIPRSSFARLARYCGCSTSFAITVAKENGKRNPPVRRGRRAA